MYYLIVIFVFILDVWTIRTVRLNASDSDCANKLAANLDKHNIEYTIDTINVSILIIYNFPFFQNSALKVFIPRQSLTDNSEAQWIKELPRYVEDNTTAEEVLQGSTPWTNEVLRKAYFKNLRASFKRGTKTERGQRKMAHKEALQTVALFMELPEYPDFPSARKEHLKRRSLMQNIPGVEI
ncbi:hypothetical protein HELRODRAFT_176515 [Helobdella robusta]|uniref:Uncharacterized protein n=1 Tax=Helobdella robusta TaxID=6412 RepID=T1FAL5_HELRO|nr:hypothetical protein HELRODRAFT_176515 [Helobdella robusta]ESN99753.1 hypothetical protein HELRODRAFT_176515 [Helobdella robusta]